MRNWRRSTYVPGRVFDAGSGETTFGLLHNPATRLPEAKTDDAIAYTPHIQDPLEIRSAA